MKKFLLFFCIVILSVMPCFSSGDTESSGGGQNIVPVLDFSAAQYFKCGFSSQIGSDITTLQPLGTYTINTVFDSLGNITPDTSSPIYAYWYVIAVETVNIYMSVSGDMVNTNNPSAYSIPFKVSFSESGNVLDSAQSPEVLIGTINSNKLGTTNLYFTQLTIFSEKEEDYFDYESGKYSATLTLKVVTGS